MQMASDRAQADQLGAEMQLSSLALSREKSAAFQLALNSAKRDATIIVEEREINNMCVCVCIYEITVSLSCVCVCVCVCVYVCIYEISKHACIM